MAFVRHAVRFRMSMLLHDLKKYELTQAVYPLFAEAGIPYHVFALFDYERCVRINPIDPCTSKTSSRLSRESTLS